MDSGDNSVTNEMDNTGATVIVMQDTINHLLQTKQMDKLNLMMNGTWDKKSMYVNEDKDAMEQTGDEIIYYKQTNNN
jgi:hypothetical protein